MSWRMVVVGCLRRGRPSTLSVASVARTRRWPAPLTAKAGATPTLAMTRPAAAGPTIRAPLNAAELSATALTTSSRPTVSFTNDCRTTLKSGSPDSAASGRPRAGASRLRIGSLRYLAQLLEEAPAVALEIERLVGTMAGVAVRPVRDPCTRGQRALVVGIDIGDVHADVLGLDAGTLRADRAVGAVCADPDHAVAELDQCVMDHAVVAHEPRGRDLAEAERAVQEGERGTDVLIRKLGNDRRSAPGLGFLPDCCHEHCLSSLERRRVERGLAPQLPRQVHRLHCALTLFFPFALSSSRRRARARLSRERTVPIGSSRAWATPWYESSSHAKSRSASRSPSGSASIAPATRENSTRASSARALARPSAASRPAAIRALARSRRASPRRCFSNRFDPIPYSHGSALARDASNVLRRSNAIRNSSPTSPSATLAPVRRPRKRSRVAAWRS